MSPKSSKIIKPYNIQQKLVFENHSSFSTAPTVGESIIDDDDDPSIHSSGTSCFPRGAARRSNVESVTDHFLAQARVGEVVVLLQDDSITADFEDPWWTEEKGNHKKWNAEGTKANRRKSKKMHSSGMSLQQRLSEIDKNDIVASNAEVDSIHSDAATEAACIISPNNERRGRPKYTQSNGKTQGRRAEVSAESSKSTCTYEFPGVDMLLDCPTVESIVNKSIRESTRKPTPISKQRSKSHSIKKTNWTPITSSKLNARGAVIDPFASKIVTM